VKEKRLKELMALAGDGKASSGDIMEVAGDTLLSMSRHSADIKALLTEINGKIDGLSTRLARVEKQTLSPIFQMFVEDDPEPSPDDGDGPGLDYIPNEDDALGGDE
jgi:hypothetical protein